MITKCESCKKIIQSIKDNSYSGLLAEVPNVCVSCGERYPWAKDKKNEASVAQKEKKNLLKEIFIVHGHDEAMKEATARVISDLGLRPIILHEQPNEGKTIIEKFEKNADVQFAVVLLSFDDIGRSVKENDGDRNPRARQNVILELGYFVGKLGRRHVFVLKKDNIEIPTDFSGVVYTSYDTQGSWKISLVRELRAVGYEVDANKII